MERMENFRERAAALKQQTAPLPHHTQVLASSQTHRHTPKLCGLLALGMVVGWLAPAAGQAISCGATLGPGGQFLLEADLGCGTVSPALTVRDGAHLDLGGHTISGGAGFSGGPIILLDGQGAVVHNGIVESGLFGDGIRVAGDGGHIVHRVSVFAGRSGVSVTSDYNRLHNSLAALQGGGASFSITGSQNLLDSNWGAGPQIGFLIGGDQNLLLENTSAPIPPDIPPAHEGFLIVGNENLLIRNNASAADQNGFVIDGDGNRLTGNLALNSPFSGILVSGQDTVIVGNTALDNATDLEDTHEDCDNNRWQRNVFRTSQAGTTENPACIQGQPAQGRNVARKP